MESAYTNKDTLIILISLLIWGIALYTEASSRTTNFMALLCFALFGTAAVHLGFHYYQEGIESIYKLNFWSDDWARALQPVVVGFGLGLAALHWRDSSIKLRIVLSVLSIAVFFFGLVSYGIVIKKFGYFN